MSFDVDEYSERISKDIKRLPENSNYFRLFLPVGYRSRPYETASTLLHAVKSIIPLLPENIDSLQLYHLDYYSTMVDDFVLPVIESLPKTLHHLSLAGNRLSNFLGSVRVYDKNESMYKFYNRDPGILIKILQALPANVVSLDLSNIHRGAMLVETFAAILKHLPSSLRVLNLSNNSLSELSTTEMELIINSIPFTVEEINLENNGLFKKRQKIKARDKLLQILGPPENRQRFKLKNNGESDFARAICAMTSFALQFQQDRSGSGLPVEIIITILSFLHPGLSKNPESPNILHAEDVVTKARTLLKNKKTENRIGLGHNHSNVFFGREGKEEVNTDQEDNVRPVL
ncbi:leucine-rich repeat domain-containing protein [Legionella spiritensis]|uniref:Leucine-rich repeat protein n=1 Tax=Legionella spiritensis TaxID=452 RepID=A0A0W0Z6I5_LEGSP|nr:hypothetical protein [Legionella spiritensis]KTD64558.1 Leucine-rich repeat protein [Legionella spiritensis]SNV29766.1 Leucine-rich repeat protein [Legionella spiritensis]